ncbi:MAG: acyl-CoA dehydrogenase family protein [Calditrichota bacterium]
MKSPFFNEKHDSLRQSVRTFIEKEVLPNAREWENSGRIPRELWLKMGEEKFLGINYSSKLGGRGEDLFSSIVFLEELANSTLGGFTAAVNMHQFLALAYIDRFASEELQKKYLKAGISGKRIGALAINESNISSDPSAITTRAEKQKNDYVLNGSKNFVVNGVYGDFVIVAAKTDPDAGASGISLFIVDSDAKGFSSRKLDNVGWHCADTAELTFENVRVPASNLLGEENMGFYYIMECYQLERLIAAVTSVASSQFCLDHTIEHVTDRQDFDQPMSQFQSTRHTLSNLATEVEAARRLTYHAAWQYENNDQAIKECTMAKLYSTELGKRVADECLQYFGEYGYTADSLISRLYRDARITTLVGGSTDIMREIISRLVIDDFEYRKPSVSLADAPAADASSPDLPLVEEVDEVVEPEPVVEEEELKKATKPVEEPEPAKPVNDKADEPAPKKDARTVKETAAKEKSEEKVAAVTKKEAASAKPESVEKPGKVEQKKVDVKEAAEEPQLVEAEEVKPPEIASSQEIQDTLEKIVEIPKPSAGESTDPTISAAPPKSTSEPKIDVSRLDADVKGPVSGIDPKMQDDTILATPGKANGHTKPAAGKTAPAPPPPPKVRRSVPPPRLGKRQHAPKTTKHDVRTVQDIFDGMPHRFRPEKAGEYRTIFHFKLSGEMGGEYTVKISSGQCTVEDGLSGDPRCVVETSDKTYMDIELGKTNPQVAFMMGKVKVSNIPEMTHFGKVFRKLHGT